MFRQRFLMVALAALAVAYAFAAVLVLLRQPEIDLRIVGVLYFSAVMCGALCLRARVPRMKSRAAMWAWAVATALLAALELPGATHVPIDSPLAWAYALSFLLTGLALSVVSFGYVWLACTRRSSSIAIEE